MPVLLSIEEAKDYLYDDTSSYLKKNFVSKIEEYLEYKWVYLEQKSCDICYNDYEDDTSYHEHDGVDMQEIQGEDFGVIGVLDPAVHKTYFVEQILEEFDPQTNKFIQHKTPFKVIEQQAFAKIITQYVLQGRK